MKFKLFFRYLFGAIAVVSFSSLKAQTNAQIEQRVNELVRKMTLAEKVNMIHASSSFTSGGVPRLGIPELVMSDGPHGVRPEHGRDWVLDKNVYDSGTYLPTGICLAATWNRKLGYSYGAVLGSEAAFRGKDVILGPGINIIRSPLNGRNFEYLSEDPYLVSEMATGYIRGVQSQGVSACVKHFALNNQETLRSRIDVQLSERAFHEIYLPGFKAAVTKANVNTIMGSYNKIRGQWASQNYYLLNVILKQQWGFKGAVISDWRAVHNTYEAVWNGCDIEMGTDLSMLPDPDYGKFYMADSLLALINKGLIPEYLIDDKVKRILRVMLWTHVLDGKRKKGDYNTKQHQDIARKVAEEGMVLLKNNKGVLPLKAAGIQSIAVIGANAERLQSMGGGSSQVKAFYEITPLEAIRKFAGANANVIYEPGYVIRRNAKADPDAIQKAVDAALRSDVVIYVGGWTHGYDYFVWKDNAYDAEDTDKKDMFLPFGQDELIKALLKAKPNTIIVLMGGGPADITAWQNDASAILQAWWPGMEGGNALTNILFGKVNPSGKLPMTFPEKLQDVPAHKLGDYPGDSVRVYYKDDIYVGYRYYDTYKVKPAFAFGHGLSYTNFSYKNLVVKKSRGKVVVSFTVTNSGNVDGAEIAQVYVSDPKSSLPRPEKELKGFEKIFLKKGESKNISIVLEKDAFSFYNELQGRWILEPGEFRIKVGSSSADIRLTGKIDL